MTCRGTNVKNKRKFSVLILTIFLITSTSLMSGCISSEQENVVGIPEDEEPRGDFYKAQNRAEIFVPILNTYEEPKEIVVKFEMITGLGNRYSELKKIRLPANSQQEYSQEIHIPENETEDFLAEIIVSEDETGVVEIEGDPAEDHDYVLMNVTAANTNFEPKEVTISYEVVTEEGKERSEMKQVTLPETSMEEYTQKIPMEGTPEEYRAEIF